MELRHLRYFKAVYDSHGFRQAAELVHVTQSTLSHQIRQLEEELGTALFDRIGKRIVATEAGDLFISYANNALGEVDQGVRALVETSKGLHGSLRIGTTHTFSMRFIPECVATLRARHPTIRVRVTEFTADQVVQAVLAGDVDIGISYRIENLGGLVFDPLYDEHMVLVVSTTHKFARRKRLRVAELHGQPLVLLPIEYSTRRMLNGVFTACQAAPEVVVEMNTLAPMLGLVERSNVATIASENAVVGWPNLRTIPLEGPTPIRTPGILWRQDGRRTGLMRSLAAVVRHVSMGHDLRRASPG